MFNECVNECQTSQITTKIVGSQISSSLEERVKGVQEGARDESGRGIPNSTFRTYLIFIMSEVMSNLSNGFRGIERFFRSASGMPTLRSYPRHLFRFREEKAFTSFLLND